MMEAADLVIINAREMLTMSSEGKGPRCGDEMENLGIIEGAALTVTDGEISWVGKTEELPEELISVNRTTIIDAEGKTVMPGIIEPHTHLVFGGSREDELAMRLQGHSYLEILQSGGGILSTVQATREATDAQLKEAALKHLQQLMQQGITTLEAKSGYGLTVEDELRCLQLINELDEECWVDIIPTFLGAHALPPEYSDSREDYLQLVIDEMIPGVQERELASFCDVFCEEGVFSVEESRRVLEAARKAGLGLKVHADEIVALGGAQLAAEMGAISAEHLLQISEEGIEALAREKVVAVLLPATAFYLMKGKYAPARKMIEAGVPVALSTDFNPGSSPLASPWLVMGLAAMKMKMTPEEIITACTINSAHALGLSEDRGSLEVGKKGDLLVLNLPTYRQLPYFFGTSWAETVIKEGNVIL